MSVPVFAFDAVRGGYGSSIVVRGIGGAVEPGEALCILGRNGVGKSTLLRLLHGLLPLAGGTVALAGRDLARADTCHRAGLGIGYAPQERVVFDDLTVRENLTLMRRSRSLAGFEPFLEAFPVLRQRLGQVAGTLSGGERKLLSLVRVLAESRALTLLDEPTEGVQAENVQRMTAFIAQRKADGAAFVLVEQNLDFVQAVADRYLVIDQGREVRHGNRATLARDDLVVHLAV